MNEIINKTDTQDNLTYNFFQLGIFIIMLGLIIFRCINYNVEDNSWIWIINYIGMSIAFINLFLNKCFSLKNTKSKKYKPFVGFTVLMLLTVLFLFVFVYNAQSNENSNFINDIITLFALFFSLSHIVWNALLNIIVKILKV